MVAQPMNADKLPFQGLIEIALYIQKNKRRFYRVMAGYDLFGDCILYQSWGSLDSKLGNSKQQVIDKIQLQSLLEKIHDVRLKHQYDAHHYNHAGIRTISPNAL